MCSPRCLRKLLRRSTDILSINNHTYQPCLRRKGGECQSPQEVNALTRLALFSAPEVAFSPIPHDEQISQWESLLEFHAENIDNKLCF